MRVYVTLVLLLGLCLFPALAESKPWSYPLTFQNQDVEVRLLNWELTRDRKNLLVHAKLRSQAKESLYFDWKSLFRLKTGSGNSYSSNYDALVDRNGSGFTRTVNEFSLAPRERVQIMIPFLLGEDEFPLRLILPDDRESVEIR